MRGIRLRFADLVLAAQQRLAGIRHLNRFEQILARMEWSDPEIVEALLFDTEDHLICATAANLFIARSGRPITPALGRCGVAVVARAEVLQAIPRTQLRDVAREALPTADEAFLCSGVRGISPVRDPAGGALEVGPFARTLQAHWREQGSMPECAT